MLLYLQRHHIKEDELYCHEDKTAEPVISNQQKQSAVRAFKMSLSQENSKMHNYLPITLNNTKKTLGYSITSMF